MKRIFATLCLLLLFATIAQSVAAQTWSPNGPLPRGGHSAVLDTSTNRMTVFGGDGSSNTNPPQNLNDVWVLVAPANALGGSARNWLPLHPTGTPPAPRYGHSAGYDPGSNRMIIFGGAEGHSSPCANDVWALTNANGIGGTSAWIQLSPSGGPPAARWGQGGAYDPTSNTLIVFGGNNCFSGYFSDVWILANANGVSGNPSWTKLSASGGPVPRSWSGTVYDSTSNELVVFGGYDGSTYVNDVWVLSNANGSGGSPAWTQLFPTGILPAVRDFPSATYDPTTNRMTVFGGVNSSGVLGDTWVLTDANGLGGTPAWMQIAASSTYFPSPRASHTAVYSPATNVMIVFGGGSSAAFNDVFFLSNANGE